MSSIKTAISLLKTPEKMILPMGDKGFFNWLPDVPYLKLVYRAEMGIKLNLDSPQTFNEKLQWLKVHDRNPLYHKLVDKYEVKQIVADIIGSEYIIPTLGLWDSVETIAFDQLPTQFVLKCTHDSGSVVICKDKGNFDVESAKSILLQHMNKSIYWFGREWPYKGLKPRVIAEPYLEDKETRELRDYKLFCFNGQVKCFKVDYNRFVDHRANYYDADGNLMKLGEKHHQPDLQKKVAIPENLALMKQLAERLSSGHIFLRTDFYSVNGKIYFGEVTFFPYSGFEPFIYEENDELLGSWIELPTSI